MGGSSSKDAGDGGGGHGALYIPITLCRGYLSAISCMMYTFVLCGLLFGLLLGTAVDPLLHLITVLFLVMGILACLGVWYCNAKLDELESIVMLLEWSAAKPSDPKEAAEKLDVILDKFGGSKAQQVRDKLNATKERAEAAEAKLEAAQNTSADQQAAALKELLLGMMQDSFTSILRSYFMGPVIIVLIMTLVLIVAGSILKETHPSAASWFSILGYILLALTVCAYCIMRNLYNSTVALVTSTVDTAAGGALEAVGKGKGASKGEQDADYVKL